MAEPLLEIKDIFKSFPDGKGGIRPVLGGISFSLPHAAVVTLLGASGCGKTTLLRILSGLEAPDAGTLRSPLVRPGDKIAYCQQGEKLLPWCTVTENVALGLDLLWGKKKQHQQRAESLLTQLGLGEFSGRYPAELSGGMTQRALLARSLATEPALLLLDEPLGQLDIAGRRDLAAFIREYVSRTGASALFVTHSVEEAVFVSDVVITLARRPAGVTGAFVLTPGVEFPGAVRLPRAESFQPVLDTLMKTLVTAMPGEGT